VTGYDDGVMAHRSLRAAAPAKSSQRTKRRDKFKARDVKTRGCSSRPARRTGAYLGLTYSRKSSAAQSTKHQEFNLRGCIANSSTRESWQFSWGCIQSASYGAGRIHTASCSSGFLRCGSQRLPAGVPRVRPAPSGPQAGDRGLHPGSQTVPISPLSGTRTRLSRLADRS
jgi:hypothetical protein